MKVTFQHKLSPASEIVEHEVYVQVVPEPSDEMVLNDILYKVLARKFHFQFHRDGLKGFHTQTAVIQIRKVDTSDSLNC